MPHEYGMVKIKIISISLSHYICVPLLLSLTREINKVMVVVKNQKIQNQLNIINSNQIDNVSMNQILFILKLDVFFYIDEII